MRIFFLNCNFVFLLLIQLLFSSYAYAASYDRELYRAIESSLNKTEKAFSGTEVHGDAGFFMAQGAMLTGRKINISLTPGAFVAKNVGLPEEYMLWNMRNDKLIQLKKRKIPDDTKKYKKNLGDTLLVKDWNKLMSNYNWQSKWMLIVMKNVMTCSGSESLTSLIGKPDYEYVAAHQLASILLAVDRKCISEDEANQRSGPYISRVVHEFNINSDEISDLQVERAAVLAMAGRVDLVPISFLKKLIALQTDGGFWVVDEPLQQFGLISWGHTTALSYYLLSAVYARTE